MDGITNDFSQSIMTTQNFKIKEPENHVQEKEAPENQIETMYDAVSSQGDTLSISEAGKALNSGDGIVSLSRSDADGTVLQKESEVSLPESESNSTVNLSIYTAVELKQMYLDGDITKNEYDEELSSREVMK